MDVDLKNIVFGKTVYLYNDLYENSYLEKDDTIFEETCSFIEEILSQEANCESRNLARGIIKHSIKIEEISGNCFNIKLKYDDCVNTAFKFMPDEQPYLTLYHSRSTIPMMPIKNFKRDMALKLIKDCLEEFRAQGLEKACI